MSSFFTKSFQAWRDTFSKVNRSIAVGEQQKIYDRIPNLSHYLPWTGYDTQHQLLILEDGKSRAGFLKISDIPTEALSVQDLKSLRSRLTLLFQGIIPLDSLSPWHLQWYVEDEYELSDLKEAFKNRIKPWAFKHPFTQAYQACLFQHLEDMTRAGGLFFDHQLTGHAFRGKRRVIRLCFYRRVSANLKKESLSEATELNRILSRIEAHLKSVGCDVHRMAGQEIFDWLFKWFNPQNLSHHTAPITPVVDAESLPYGFDWSEQLFCTAPQAIPQEGFWRFGEYVHQLLSIDGLSQIPWIGQLTQPDKRGRFYSSLFDQLPAHSRFVITIVFIHPEQVNRKLNRVKKSCVGDHPESQLTRKACDQALVQHEDGNYILPCSISVYCREKSVERLKKQREKIFTLMSQYGFKMLGPEVEVYPLHAYLRCLPANYQYALENKIPSSRFIFAQQIANLLPLYGRYKGSGRPGLLYWTRNAENFCFDPFDPQDKSANSHLLFLSETGGGKSAALVYHLMQIIALYQPRVFIIEAGESFKLFCDYAAHYGLSTQQVKLSVEQPTPLNPFSSLLAIKNQPDHLGSERDYLGEMSLAAQLMVTGGDPKEEARMTRANQAILTQAIELAAQEAIKNGIKEVLTEHVVHCLYALANSESQSVKAARIQEMADAMSHFVHDPFSSSFFNRPGVTWPEVDVTRLDMGLMKEAQYSAQLAIAVMSMLSRILNLAENHQYQNRMTVVLIDEAHILTKNRLTAQHITQFSKMCRKLGMWLWLATQNISDFPEESKKMLSMIEFWIGLGTSEQEIDEIRRYKQMTDEEKALFMSVRKEIPHYVEGVVLSRKIKGLFRNVPPRLALALGMSEQIEKARRQTLMQERGISEVEAAIHMANELTYNQGQSEHED